jgi:hypothetical protein
MLSAQEKTAGATTVSPLLFFLARYMERDTVVFFGLISCRRGHLKIFKALKIRTTKRNLPSGLFPYERLSRRKL